MSFSRAQIKLAAVFGALAATAMPFQASADEVADFYRGKQLSIQVGFAPGGGYDTTARIFARHFGKYVPGNPSVIVQNLPGGGSMKLVDKLYNATPNNGLVIGSMTPQIMMVPLFGKRKTKFVTSKFEWIGSLHQDIMGCAVWKGAGQGIKTLPDLIAAKNPIIFGSSSPASLLSTYPLFLKGVFGAKIKIVHGYRGTRPINLAMQKGEVHGSCGMYESSVRGAYLDSFKAGHLNVFMQLGEHETVPFFKNATPIYSLLKTEEQKQMARLLFGPGEITRPIAAPPGTPKARVAALSKALLDTMKDPGLIKDGKRINTTFRPMSGKQVADAFASYYATPRALVDKTYDMTYQKRTPRKK
jgi:tripartite-type tricarboxylate transporter receptor subunit TctC